MFVHVVEEELTVPLAVMVLLQGHKIIPFIRPWSTMTIIESYPWDLGKSVIKSIDIWAKGLLVGDPLIGIKGGLVRCLLILDC